MIFVWGKRSYGAIRRVGNISIKTVFGHLWYLPLFPMTSYYVDTQSKAAYELNGLHWRSVLFGYLRVWLPVIFAFTFIATLEKADGSMTGPIICILALAAFLGTYLYDKKTLSETTTNIRWMMHRHFGVALDPHETLANLQQEIEHKKGNADLPETWYKEAIHDAQCDHTTLELALLRARCDQHDKELQQVVLRKIPQLS